MMRKASARPQPGDWYAVQSVPSEGIDCYWIKSLGEEIGAVYGPQNPTTESWANMVAAAPDLLYVLNGFIACADQFEASEDRNQADAYYAFVKGIGDLWERARAAAARAGAGP